MNYPMSKIYLITGAASGIGLATARRLQAQGNTLILWDTAPLEVLAGELNAAYAQVDISDSVQVQTALQKIQRLDGLIHCAGILRTGLFENLPLETHHAMIQVNLIGTLNMVYATLPMLKAARGQLILMASAASFYGAPEYSSYGASKAGVMNFAQAIQLEVPEIRVGVVFPHTTDTPMVRNLSTTTQVIRRYGMVHTADEVAAALVRGMERGHFMIWPNHQPRLLFWATRFFSPMIFRWVLKRLWEDKKV